jgi:uncharacterized protein
MLWTAVPGGVRLRLKLTPKASRDALGAVETLSDGTQVLRAYVRAVPEDGKANRALVKLLSVTLKLPVSAIELESGATSRMKAFRLAGDIARLETLLQGLCTE